MSFESQVNEFLSISPYVDDEELLAQRFNVSVIKGSYVGMVFNQSFWKYFTNYIKPACDSVFGVRLPKLHQELVFNEMVAICMKHDTRSFDPDFNVMMLLSMYHLKVKVLLHKHGLSAMSTLKKGMIGKEESILKRFGDNELYIFNVDYLIRDFLCEDRVSMLVSKSKKTNS
jgi:hypothetical protein